MSIKTKILTIALLLATAFTAFAQQEIPMFFDRHLGLQTAGQSIFGLTVASSTDGSRVAIANSGSNTVVIFDAATGQVISRLAGHRGSITGIVFSPNGRQVASCSPSEGSIRIWNPITGEQLHNISVGARSAIAFSPDGSRLVGGFYVSESDRGIKIWSTENGREMRTIALTTGNVQFVSYSPDGRQILVTTNDGIRILDAANGQPIRTIYSGMANLNAVYSPNGQHIAAYIRDRRENIMGIRIYNAQNGQELRTIPAGLSPFDLMYSPDGRQLLVNGWTDDGNTRIMQIFDPDTGRELRRFNNEDEAIAFISDGRRILTAVSRSFEVRIDGTPHYASFANILDANTGATVRTIGYGPLNIGARALADYRVLGYLGGQEEELGHISILQYISLRGLATRMQIERFYLIGIRILVSNTIDELFGSTIFYLDDINSQGSYRSVLRRNPQSGEHVLSYTGSFGTTRVLSAPSLEALAAAMRNSGDFAPDAANALRTQALMIPAVTLGNNAVEEIKNIITNFFLTPNLGTYSDVLDIEIIYDNLSSGNGINETYFNILNAYRLTLGRLNNELYMRVLNVGRYRTAPQNPNLQQLLVPPR